MTEGSFSKLNGVVDLPSQKKKPSLKIPSEGSVHQNLAAVGATPPARVPGVQKRTRSKPMSAVSVCTQALLCFSLLGAVSDLAAVGATPPAGVPSVGRCFSL